MLPAKFTRWIYEGRRPNQLARFMNKFWEMIGASGIGGDWVVTLEVTGRKSGRPVSLPLVMVVMHGQRYLVSMLGDNVQWVQNVRAAHGSATLIQGSREAVKLEEVPVNQRPPILKEYLRRAPGGRPHIPIDMNAPLAEFEKVVGDFPVFVVKSA